MKRSYHVALAVDVDQRSDRYLREHILPWAKLNGRHLTVAEFRAACAEARAAGLRVFRPCGNTLPDGSCAGHDSEEMG